MILSWDNKNYKGSKEQRQAQNTNKVMMKLEQGTATKADIWLETNGFGDKWSTRQKVRDTLWKTHKGEQAKEPDTTTKADRWLETN